jgi:hypothetical protein
MATPIPEVIQSLPPVTIRHVMEGPNPWGAFTASLVLAAAGITVGLWTLRKVYDQIGIATKQLRLAEEELAAVKADFELATRMYEQSTKRPDLHLTISLTNEAMDTFEHSLRRVVSLDIRLTNQGHKVAHNVLVEGYLPDTAFFSHPSLNLAWPRDSMETIEGTVYRRVTWGEGRLRVPIRGTTHWEWSISLAPDVPSVRILYRIYDDEYSYPDGWGSTTLDFGSPGALSPPS